MEKLKRREEGATTANYVWQPIIAMIFFGVCLVFLNWVAKSEMLWVACAGALAASAYIVFAFPSSLSARWINILGGYVFGIVFGEILHFLAIFFEWVVAHTFTVPTMHVYEFTAFIGLLFTIWLMLLFRLSHPPVVVVVLAMMMEVNNYLLLLVTLLGAVLLTILKIVLYPALRDLVG